MKSGARAVAVAAVAVLCAGSGPGWAADRSAAGSAPVTIVGPLEPNGAVKISGTATVNGTVGATQSGAWSVGQSGSWSVEQAGGWSVGLEGPASASLANIDAATSALRYDEDGNLKVSIAGGSSLLVSSHRSVGSSDPTIVSFTVSGYLVDLP